MHPAKEWSECTFLDYVWKLSVFWGSGGVRLGGQFGVKFGVKKGQFRGGSKVGVKTPNLRFLVKTSKSDFLDHSDRNGGPPRKSDIPSNTWKFPTSLPGGGTPLSGSDPTEIPSHRSAGTELPDVAKLVGTQIANLDSVCWFCRRELSYAMQE